MGADEPQQEQGTPLKECKGCSKRKPLGEYHRNKAKTDGLEDKCKTCKAERDANRRAARPEVRARQESVEPYTLHARPHATPPAARRVPRDSKS